MWDEKGNLKFVGENATILGGRVGALENIFKTGVVPREHLTVSEQLQTQKGSAIENIQSTVLPDTDDAAHNYNRKVAYMVIGNKGTSDAAPLVNLDPMDYETRLYNMVPFRCVPTIPATADLSPEDRAKYRMRRKETINNIQYYTYYLKKIDVSPVDLKLTDGSNYTPVYENSEPVEPSGSSNPHPLADTAVHALVTMNLSIDKDEFKEYYRIKNGSLDNASLSELGLVLADEPVDPIEVDGVSYNEVRNAELFSKIVFSAEPMDSEGNSKSVLYQILAY